MDSTAEPIVQAETPSSGAEEQVGKELTHQADAAQAQPADDDDAFLETLLGGRTVAPEPQEGEQAAPDPAAEARDPAPAFDRDAAAKVLKRDGVPDEIIASASPETLARWVDAAAKRQKDVDSYGGRLKQLEEQLAKQDPAKAVEPQDNKPAPAPAADDPFAQMAETYGEDLVAPVRLAFQQQQQRMHEQILLAQARSADLALRAQYGGKSPKYDAVLAKMNELGTARPGGFASVDELAAAAYDALVGSRPAPVNAKASQPTAPKGATAPVKPPPRDEDDEILDRIISGQPARLARSTRN